MIAFIEGRLVESAPAVTIAVGDGSLALNVQVSARAAAALPPPGETVRLWTHLAVREDGWTLYGFPWTEERDMFRLLISVNGVGPKLALGLLSAASPRDLARHLRLGDEKSLAALPGIGRKSAARLVVELGRRVPETELETGGTAGTGPAGGGEGTLAEALRVMQAMGLGPAQAERALLEARRAEPAVADDLERWVKGALGRL